MSSVSPRALRRIAMISVHGCPMAMPGVRLAGGMNIYLRRIAPLLADQGICVDVFTRSHHAGGEEIVHLGPRARVIHLPAGSPELVKTEVIPYLPQFIDEANAFAAKEGLGYDLVYSHYWLSGWVGMRIARDWGVPHVVCFHTIAGIKEMTGAAEEPPERKAVEAEVVRSADRIFAFTQDEVQLIGRLFGVPAGRCDVVPGGVDLELFRPRDRREARRRLGIDEREKVVLFVGRIEPFKGPDVLVRALGAMRDRSNVRLVFVGGSLDEHSDELLLRPAREEGVIDRITWHEAVPQTELIDYYAAADLCAVPSYHETFGFAALESMACGTPVVAARVGALPSLVVDGVTGRLVDGHDPRDFAACIEDLLAKPALLEGMGAAGRRRAEQFPWASTAEKTIDGCIRALHGFAERPEVSSCPAAAQP